MISEENDWDHCAGILTETGILMNNGTTMTEGKVFELAKRVKSLYDVNDYRGFNEVF